MFLPHLQTFRKLIPEHISRVFFGDLQFDVKMHEVFQDDALSLSTSAVYAFMQSPSNIHQKFSPQFVHLPVLLNKYSASGGTTRTGKLFAGPARRVTGSRNFLAGTRPQGRL